MIDEIYNYRQNNMPTVEFSAEWSKPCIPFEKSLTEEQLITFHKLLDIQSTTLADEARTAYRAGFKDRVGFDDRFADFNPIKNKQLISLKQDKRTAFTTVGIEKFFGNDL